MLACLLEVCLGLKEPGLPGLQKLALSQQVQALHLPVHLGQTTELSVLAPDQPESYPELAELQAGHLLEVCLGLLMVLGLRWGPYFICLHLYFL